MIGMYDEPVAVPIIDLLDSSMMSQYISAAREQYNQAVQEQKEFAKEFGDLYSPSASLNKAYYDQTKGRINAGLNYLYQNGIDPLRSAEGRAYIAKIVRETPYAQLANWKSDAENMRTYNKAAAALMAEGKYDKDYANWMLEQQGLAPMEKFDPYSDRRWTALSPAQYETLDQFTKPYGDAIKPGLLDKEAVEGLGQQYDPKNDYLGISYQQIDKAANSAAQALKATPQGKFEVERIKRQMIAEGLNPTEADADKIFASRIAQSFRPKAGIQTMDANKYAYADYANQLANELDAKKSARDLANQKAMLKEQYKYGAAGGKGSSKLSIFDIARAYPKTSAGLNVNSDLSADGVALDKNVKVTKYPSVKGSSNYTQLDFNTGDVPTFYQKKNSDKMVYLSNAKPKQITAKMLGGLQYVPEYGRYMIKCQILKIGGVKKAPQKGKVNEVWIEATETVKHK